MMRWKVIVLIAFALCFFHLSFASDQSYISPIFDAEIDYALRIRLIQNAKKSIQIVTYQQQADDRVGIPLMAALREALARGVKVQFITSRIVSALYDPHQYLSKMLLDRSLKGRIELYYLNLFKNKLHGWNYSDNIHEKIFIVDDEYAIVGGRNQGASYLRWLDFSALIEGYSFIKKLHLEFDRLINTVAKVSGPEGVRDVSVFDLPNPVKWISPYLQSRSHDLDEILAHKQTFLVDSELVSNHFLEQLLSKMGGPNLEISPSLLGYNFLHLDSDEVRMELNDDILDQMVQRIDAVQPGSKIQLSTMFAKFHPRFKVALKNAITKGAEVEILTNSAKSTTGLVPFGLAYYDGLLDLRELLIFSKKVNGRFKLYSLDSTKGEAAPLFLHKKVLIIDDHVFFGSHNFTLPSSIANSELEVQIADKKFSDLMSKKFKLEKNLYATERSLEEIIIEVEKRWPQILGSKFIHNFF